MSAASAPHPLDVRATVRRHAPQASEHLDGTTYDLPDGSMLCLAPQGWVLVRGTTVTPLYSLAQLRLALGRHLVLVPGSCGPLLTVLGVGAVPSTYERKAQRDLQRLGLTEPHPDHPSHVRLSPLGSRVARSVGSTAELDLFLLDPDDLA